MNSDSLVLKTQTFLNTMLPWNQFSSNEKELSVLDKTEQKKTNQNKEKTHNSSEIRLQNHHGSEISIYFQLQCSTYVNSNDLPFFFFYCVKNP